jgi:signal transduction histidine kinase
VLDNLLNNAMNYPRWGIVGCRLTQGKEDGRGRDRWVEVRVSDTGTGSSEEIERIFNNFTKAHTIRANRSVARA